MSPLHRLTGVVFVLLSLGSALLCHQIITNSVANQAYKNAYAELHHVQYGFLSIEEWKKRILDILSDEIEGLELSTRNAKELRQHVEALLHTLIGRVADKIREANKGSAKGWVRQFVMDLFISLEEIKKGVPEYADAVIREMTRAKTERRIKAMLNEGLKEYSSRTFNTQDTTRLNRVLRWTGAPDVESAKRKVNRAVRIRQDLLWKEAFLLILISVVLFGWTAFGGAPLTASRYVFLMLSLVFMLAAGVTTPMIDMEAKISRISFVLMGHPIQFENQVLYFQTKSILDVFWIMVTHQDLEMKFVGILVITFSIVFPLLKIVASFGYYYNIRHARENPVIRFFVFKSGKWSMADVMVVAIFMAYIGFNGMISGQLGQLAAIDRDLMLMTTNGTSLQPGYFLFLTYTLLAMGLSGVLARNFPLNASITPPGL